MEKLKFNDWQIMAIKKDLEVMTKVIKEQKSTTILMFLQISLAVIVPFMIYFLQLGDDISFIWIVLLSSPIIGYVIWQSSKKIENIYKTKHGRMSNQEFVSIFDDKICNWTMIANSYARMLQSGYNLDLCKKVYLFYESSYYRNKAIMCLARLGQKAESIFSYDNDDIVFSKKISLERLSLLVDVLKIDYVLINTVMLGIANEQINKQIELNEVYDKQMESFLNIVNLTFKCEMSW